MRWSENTYRILGVDRRTFVPTYGTVLNLIHSDDRDFFTQAASDSINQSKPYDIELGILQPGGAIRILHSKAEIKSDDDGQPVKFVGMVQDITERRQREEERQRMLDVMEELAQS